MLLMPSDILRVLVIAGDSLARAGLAAMISELPGYNVVGQTAGSIDMANEVELYEPDVIIWDLGLNPASSLKTLTAVGELRTPFVVLVPDEDAAILASTHGLRNILSRDVEDRVLLAAMRAAVEGLATIDSELFDALFPAKEKAPEQPVEPLTSRELEVLQLVSQGMTNRAIALHLAISEHTVKFHVNSILGKLGASSRTEAVSRATRLGLVRL